MTLQNFSASLVTSAVEAKNLLTLLIGFNFTGLNSADAIISLYESFPDNYKIEDALFAVAFKKLFHKYPIQAQHLPYFLKYSPMWPTFDKEIICKNNVIILGGSSKKTFKNSLEFSKGLSVYAYHYDGTYQASMNFINDNKECIFELVKKNKSKFIENLSKQKCWPKLINGNYKEFTKFCTEFNLNKFDIIKSEFFSSFYGLKHDIKYFTDEQLYKMLSDLHEQPNFYNGTTFFTCSSKRENRYAVNVLHVAILCLHNNMQKSFSFIYKNYSKELSHCMTDYFVDPSESPTPNDATNTQHWISTLIGMTKNCSRYGHKEPFDDMEMKHIQQTIMNNPKIFDLMVLDMSLSNKNESASKRLKL